MELVTQESSLGSPAAGEVITFYSYKGGTGRTMAMVNVACLLARRGDGRVLLLDWDLEAPGLHHYFAEPAQSEDSRDGLVELICAATRRLETSATSSGLSAKSIWDEVNVPAYVRPTGIDGVDFVRAGNFADAYGDRVSDLKWKAWFEHCPDLFPALAHHLTAMYRWVLIDARTGTTDTTGICTVLMPDKLVLVFTPNRQSLQGITDLTQRAAKWRADFGESRPLLVYPLPSRIDSARESLRKMWREGNESLSIQGYQPLFENALANAYGLDACSLQSYFNEVQLQHESDFAFGERIAVLDADRTRTEDRFSIVRSYEALLSWLAEGIPAWEDRERWRAMTALMLVEEQLDAKRSPDDRLTEDWATEWVRLHLRRLECARAAHGANSHEAVLALVELATAHLKHSDTTAALRTLADWRPSLTVDIRTLQAMTELAVALVAEGEWNQGLEWAERARDGLVQVLGPDHPQTRAAASTWAGIVDARNTQAASRGDPSSVVQPSRSALEDLAGRVAGSFGGATTSTRSNYTNPPLARRQVDALRVYLSSTTTDLAAYRQVANDALLRLQQQLVVMEHVGALPGTPVAECERMSESSDVVVCIVAHRYGFEPEPGRGSLTRREVEAAHRAGRPVLAWIVDDKYPWTEAKEQDRLTQPEVLEDPAKASDVFTAIRGLQEFKAWLRSQFVTETFTTPDHLARSLMTALANVAAARSTVSSRGEAPHAPPELRIVHALQPAPHFAGREAILERLSAWIDDVASADRVQALVAIGGTGKTAVVERVVTDLRRRWPLTNGGSALVWSFYEQPDVEAFLRECAALFLGEDYDAPVGGRLERLLGGLRAGCGHVLVLDGLETVQAEGGRGRVRGEFENHSLKLLLQAVASGLGRTRALLTSRFPLTDLRDWKRGGFIETLLEDLSPVAARNVLRGWGVRGNDAQLDAVNARVGGHALSLSVIGSYVSHFEAGRVEAASVLTDLDSAATDDPKAAQLARVLSYYAERLPTEERQLLARLSLFPGGVSLELLGALIEAGGDVAGALINAKPALTRLLARLVERGLVSRDTSADSLTRWTAHPFIRERFAALIDCPPEKVLRAGAGHGRRQDR